MDITNILLIIIIIAGAIITRFLVPYLKVRFSAEELNTIFALVKMAVDAAEQIFGAGKGKEKKQFVIEYFKSKGYTLDTNIISDELNAMIEAAVYKLNSKEASSGGKEEKVG